MAKTDERASREHRGAAAVWATLLAAGFGWGMWSLGHADVRQDIARPAAWLDGTAGAALNRSLRLPAQAGLETAGAAARYRLLGDLGDQAALGCPQWMFYRDGLRPQPGVAAGVLDARLRLMRHWSQQLRAQHIRLLVVVVPDKSRIEARHLCGLAASAPMRGRLDAWRDALRGDGVPFVDLRDALAGRADPMFFRTDVHMTPAGARIAADAVARAALPLLDGARGEQTFSIGRPGTPAPRMGDLIELSGLRHAPDGWRPALDRVAPQTIAPLRAGGLLDDAPPVDVMLAGSSNGRRSNFAPWLGDGLGREVWNVSVDGGQFAGALLSALRQRASWPPALRLVIWEFSEYALSLPLTDDEKAALAHLSDDPHPA